MHWSHRYNHRSPANSSQCWKIQRTTNDRIHNPCCRPTARTYSQLLTDWMSLREYFSHLPDVSRFVREGIHKQAKGIHMRTNSMIHFMTDPCTGTKAAQRNMPNPSILGGQRFRKDFVMRKTQLSGAGWGREEDGPIKARKSKKMQAHRKAKL